MMNPAKPHQRPDQQEHGQELEGSIVDRSLAAVAFYQRILDVIKPRMLPEREKRHGKFVLVPAEAGIVEVNHMHGSLADQQISRVQIRMDHAVGAAWVVATVREDFVDCAASRLY